MIKGWFPILTSLPIFAQCNGSQSETSAGRRICIKQSPRDVFKESRRGDGCKERLFYYYALFKWGILPVYPAAEGNRHFVWGHHVNIPPTGGWSCSGEGCGFRLYNSTVRSAGRGRVLTSEAEVKIAPVGQRGGRQKWMMEPGRR